MAKGESKNCDLGELCGTASGAARNRSDYSAGENVCNVLPFNQKQLRPVSQGDSQSSSIKADKASSLPRLPRLLQTSITVD
jgi:hypothetical protein